MSEEPIRIGEVIEACTTEFVAQSYELYSLPPFGSLVKTKQADIELYGLVYLASTSGMEPGRRPIARGKDETSDDAIYQSNPQLVKLLRSEFRALSIGYKQSDKMFHHLPPNPAQIHKFVYLCSSQEVKQFSRSFHFLDILLKSRLPVSVEELVTGCLRYLSQSYAAERQTFLVAAGKELATLLVDDFSQLKTILRGLKYDAAK